VSGEVVGRVPLSDMQSAAGHGWLRGRTRGPERRGWLCSSVVRARVNRAEGTGLLGLLGRRACGRPPPARAAGHDARASAPIAEGRWTHEPAPGGSTCRRLLARPVVDAGARAGTGARVTSARGGRGELYAHPEDRRPQAAVDRPR